MPQWYPTPPAAAGVFAIGLTRQALADQTESVAARCNARYGVSVNSAMYFVSHYNKIFHREGRKGRQGKTVK